MRKIIPASFFRTRTYPLDSLSATTSPRLPRCLLPDTIFSSSRSLAQIQSNHERFPEGWYTSSGPLGPALGPNNLPRSEQYKVDERTLNLGKSKQMKNHSDALEPNRCSTFCHLTGIMNSDPDAAIPSTHPARLPASARNPLPPHYASSLSIDPPSSPHGFGESCLPRRVLDGAHGVGPRAARG